MEEQKDHIHCWNAYDKKGDLICATCGMKKQEHYRNKKEVRLKWVK